LDGSAFCPRLKEKGEHYGATAVVREFDRCLEQAVTIGAGEAEIRRDIVYTRSRRRGWCR